MSMPDVLNSFYAGGATLVGPTVWTFAWTLLKIVCVLLPLMGLVAYLVLWERKLIGWIHIRVGPNRVGPLGLLQPIADALKLLLKEIVVPAKATPSLFIIGPIMTIMPALAAWSVIPVRPGSGAGQRQRRPAAAAGDHLDGGVRHHHRRLGVELEVLVHGRDARLGPDDLVRNPDGLRDGGDPDGVRFAELLGHRRRADPRHFAGTA
jgi:hypothetical protein